MSKVLILVEGQTEEEFVKNLLTPHLAGFGVFPVPKIVTTRRPPDRAHFKGGISSYKKIKTDLRLLLSDQSAVLITTMIDYYGLPDDFPGMADCPTGSGRTKVRHLEREFATNVSHLRFLPYLSLHEFEALLFASPQQIDNYFPDENQLHQLEMIQAQFTSPEEINDNPDSAPSKRLHKLYPDYQKTTDGPTIAQRIGIDLIRSECPHFNEWLAKLESLGRPSA